MKKNTQWWQIITLLVGVLIPVTAGMIGMSNKQSAQEVRLQKLENQQYDNQLKVEKEFDKIGVKIDKINETTTKTLIELQNKADRPR